MTGYFAYIRVSTHRQGEQGASLDEQRAAITRYAAEHGLQITRWFEEQVTAAKRGRPVFNLLLMLLTKDQAQGLIIHAIDRGVRNLWDWARVGELLDQGVDVRIVRENIDLQGRGGRLAADIQAVVAADFVRNLKQETLKGFYGRLKQGIYPLKAPLGYLDNGSGHIKTICPTKGPLVRTAFELYARGNLTLGMLSTELYHRGLKNRRGSRFSDNGVSAILNNPFYVGLIRIRKLKETFPGAHAPLISRSLFDRVQNVLHGRTQKRVRKHDLLYRGLLHCPQCKHYLVGEIQDKQVYYRCHQKHASPPCLPEAVITESVARTLKEVSQEELERLATNTEQADAYTTDDAERFRLRDEIIRQRLERLEILFHEGSIDRTDFWSRKNAYHMERLELAERIARAEDRKEHRANEFHELFTRTRDFGTLPHVKQRQVAQWLFTTRCLTLAGLTTEPQSVGTNAPSRLAVSESNHAA